MAGAGAGVSESIFVTSEPIEDGDGNIAPGGQTRRIDGCVIDTAGQSVINGEDVSDGNSDRLRILAPPGKSLFEGEVLTVRGERYVVVHIPFDYSIGRRPVMARHRPKVLVIAERREG